MSNVLARVDASHNDSQSRSRQVDFKSTGDFTVLSGDSSWARVVQSDGRVGLTILAKGGALVFATESFFVMLPVVNCKLDRVTRNPSNWVLAQWIVLDSHTKPSPTTLESVAPSGIMHGLALVVRVPCYCTILCDGRMGCCVSSTPLKLRK